MSNLCELTGQGPADYCLGFRSRILDMTVHLKVSKKSFFDLARMGNDIDSWLWQTNPEMLTAKARRLRWEIVSSHRQRYETPPMALAA